MTAYRHSLLILSGLLAAAAAAQPRLHAPDPSAYAQPDLNHRLDTRGDRHPHVERGKDGTLVFRNEHLVAELARGSDGTYGPLYLYPATRPSQPWAAPVAVVTDFGGTVPAAGEGGASGTFQPRSVEVQKDDRVLLKGTAGAGGDAEATLAIGRDPWMDWSVRLLHPSAGAGTQYHGLTLGIGHTGPRTVLLPGLTFAEQTENVSGYPLYPAITPDPTQITVPFAGAAQGDVTVALMWNPSQNWGGSGYPTMSASFPNSATGVAGTVSLATPPPGAAPSAPAGSRSAPSGAGAVRPLTLSGKLLVRRDTENVATALRCWDDAYGDTASEVQKLLHEDRTHFIRNWDESRALARKVYGGTSATAPGAGDMADRELARDAEVEDALVQLLDSSLRGTEHGSPSRTAAETALSRMDERGPLDPRLAYRTGGVVRSLTALREQVQGLIRSQVARGSWPLDVPSDRPDFTEDLRILPEKPADVEVGTVTQNALPVLRYAVLTGDSDAAGAGIRALEYIDRPADRRPFGRFRIPAGAGVPFARRQVPSLYAATQAAQCFLLGYQLTGQLRYLDSARYWADTGLPFVYLWEDPQRPALRGATIPRFGPDSAGSVSYGQASQRVGLYYARMLQELTQVRPDRFYDRVVRAITASALRQQPGNGENAGLLPERWDVREGRAAGGWLTPGPLLVVQAATNRYNTDVSHVRVRTGPDRIFVASGAQIDRPDTSAMRLRLNLSWAAGEESYTTITGVAARPIRVEYNSTLLPAIQIPVTRHYLREASEEFGPGWFYDEETGLLTIRVRHNGHDDHLEVRWPDPRERTPVDRVDIRVRNNR